MQFFHVLDCRHITVHFVTDKLEELGRSSGEVIGFSGSATSSDSGQINLVALRTT